MHPSSYPINHFLIPYFLPVNKVVQAIMGTLLTACCHLIKVHPDI